MTSIYVVGYPKSGNTYTARLIGEVLQAPVTGEKNAVPIATEGLHRGGNVTVKQLHLKLSREKIDDNFLASAVKVSFPNWQDQKVVHVIRDPRDVAVSCMFYWEIESLERTLHYMAFAPENCPLYVHGSWKSFVEPWWKLSFNKEVDRTKLTTVFYERLVHMPNTYLPFKLEELYPNMIFPDNFVDEAVKAQSFDVKRAEIGVDGDSRPYGKSIQLKNMRKGKSGDWVNYFSPETARIAEAIFQPLMGELGYGHENEWRKLVEA